MGGMKRLLAVMLVGGMAFLQGPGAGTAWSAEEAAEDDLSSLLNEAPQGEALKEEEPERWGGVKLDGELRANLWYQYSADYEWKTTNRLDLLAEKEDGPFRAAGRLKLDYQNVEADPDARADVRELNGRYRVKSSWFDYLDLTAGKKILYWGKGDEFRPLDIACPEDMTTYLFYLKNERKTGVLGLFGDLALNQHFTLEVFWSPFFQRSWTPDVGDYFEPLALKQTTGAGIWEGPAVEPDGFSDMASAGARLKLSAFRTDVGLYAYQGYSNLPTYQITSLAVHPYLGLPIIPTEIQPEYYRTTMFGLDFERAVGDFVFRGEMAWFTGGNYANLDWVNDPALLLTHPSGVEEADKLQYVAGVDKNDLFIRHLYVNIQYVGQYLLDYQDYFQDQEATHGMTLSVHYSMLDSKLKYRYWLVGDFTDDTWRHLLEATCKLCNWSETSLGFITYSGDGDTLFGQYDDKDFVYAQLKVIF